MVRSSRKGASTFLRGKGHMSGGLRVFNFLETRKLQLMMTRGHLAQLVRASRLHREGRESESLSAHIVSP